MSHGDAKSRADARSRRSRLRESLTIVAVAALLVGFLALAIVSLEREVGGRGLTGTITKKEFIPLRERQITIGPSGVHQREIDGVYRLHVHVASSDRDYVVDVDPRVFRDHQVGEAYYFVKPPPESTPSPTPASGEAAGGVD